MTDTPERRARKKEQDRLRQRRRRAKASPRASGPVRISITIQEPDLWRRTCEAGERESLIAITERAIDEGCRAHKKQENEAMWEKLSKARTGIMDREAACATLDPNGNWSVTDRREPPPGWPKVKPDGMTDEQWDLAIAEWREEIEEWQAGMNERNPETGEQRRVNTRHNWERDR